MHDEMRMRRCSNYQLGAFYDSLLSKRIWSSQKDLALALDVSSTHVSRLLSLSRMSSAILDALGGPTTITLRASELVRHAIDRHGEDAVIQRIGEARTAGYRELGDLLEYAVADRLPDQDFKPVRVSIGRDKRSLRVEMGDLSRFSPHLVQLEEWLRDSLAMFESRLVSQKRIAAHEARVNRLYPSRPGRNV